YRLLRPRGIGAKDLVERAPKPHRQGVCPSSKEEVMNGLTQSVIVDRGARVLRFGALIAAALMLLAFSTSASARAAESGPTIVLVHGAFASPAGWDGVAAALHKDGYQTATPALGLTSVSADVAIVQSTLDSIPGDNILVGHAYGGFVVTHPSRG